MSYYPEPDSHIRDKVISGLNHATDVDTPDLPTKKDFISLKAEVDKIDSNKLVNGATSLNNSKT